MEMSSIPEIWYKYQRWCRLVILLFQGGESACKNILYKMGIKDITDGAEVYNKLKPYESKIKKLGFYQRKTLLPDNKVVDVTKMDISLSTHIIQVLDTKKSYPQISELRYQRTELYFIPEEKRDMKEHQFAESWDKISRLLTSLNYEMNLLKSLKTAEHLTEEHKKILKDVTYKIKGNVELVLYFFAYFCCCCCCFSNNINSEILLVYQTYLLQIVAVKK